VSLSGEPLSPTEGGGYVEGGAERGNPFGAEGSNYSGSGFASSDATPDSIPTAPVASGIGKSSGSYNAVGSYQM